MKLFKKLICFTLALATVCFAAACESKEEENASGSSQVETPKDSDGASTSEEENGDLTNTPEEEGGEENSNIPATVDAAILKMIVADYKVSIADSESFAEMNLMFAEQGIVIESGISCRGKNEESLAVMWCNSEEAAKKFKDFYVLSPEAGVDKFEAVGNMFYVGTASAVEAFCREFDETPYDIPKTEEGITTRMENAGYMVETMSSAELAERNVMLAKYGISLDKVLVCKGFFLAGGRLTEEEEARTFFVPETVVKIYFLDSEASAKKFMQIQNDESGGVAFRMYGNIVCFYKYDVIRAIHGLPAFDETSGDLGVDYLWYNRVEDLELSPTVENVRKQMLDASYRVLCGSGLACLEFTDDTMFNEDICTEYRLFSTMVDEEKNIITEMLVAYWCASAESADLLCEELQKKVSKTVYKGADNVVYYGTPAALEIFLG